MSRPLPRYLEQPIHHDPLEIALAQRARAEADARAKIAAGTPPDAEPQELRGIPCIARGVPGTSPGTNPAHEITRLDNIRHVRHTPQCA